jgi:sugar phosphate isomerase/epimerase
MASPKILFSTAAFFSRPLAETFGLVADAGFRGVEVMVTKDPASQDARRMLELAEANGLQIGAIHSPCLLLTRRVWGTDPVGKLYRSVELAERVGARLVVVHPPYRWQMPYRRWLEERLPAFSEATGVGIAIENMFPVRLGTRSVTFHANQDLEELDRFDSLVLDTSHAAVANHDLMEVRRRFDGRLRHVHLSDNAGRGWDSHLPLGQGVLPIDGFLDDLATSGYDGNVTLEVDLRRELEDPAKVRELMRADRERCEARLGAVRAE